MVEIGKVNTLVVQDVRGHEILLDGGDLGTIRLEERTVSGRYQVGDALEVFVYTDAEDRLLAMTGRPYVSVGEVATLRVVATSDAGAFLAWGMKHDLLVPKSEQLRPMSSGQSYVVYVFLSLKTNRITASSKVDQFLGRDAPSYEEGQEVRLLIFDKTDLGYRAVIDQAHVGMVYANEVFQPLSIGQKLKGYIKTIREDQKIDLRLQAIGYGRVDGISQAILDVLTESGGMVALSDKSPPEEIYARFGISKKVFKKAIGALYKKRLIDIDQGSIRLGGE